MDQEQPLSKGPKNMITLQGTATRRLPFTMSFMSSIINIGVTRRIQCKSEANGAVSSGAPGHGWLEVADVECEGDVGALRTRNVTLIAPECLTSTTSACKRIAVLTVLLPTGEQNEHRH